MAQALMKEYYKSLWMFFLVKHSFSSLIPNTISQISMLCAYSNPAACFLANDVNNQQLIILKSSTTNYCHFRHDNSPQIATTIWTL